MKTSKKSYLITGSEGQLGQCFRSVAVEFPQLQFLFTKHSEVDINYPETLANYYELHPFEGIINCAAYTQVDKAETEEKEAHQINAWGVKNLIDFAVVKNLKLIHFSTDYVFDGTKETPYLEEETPNPLNVYGESKLAGEKALAESNCQSVCFRVSWLFSPFGKNFVKTIINVSQSKTELAVVEDQFGKPTYGIDLARTILMHLDNPRFFDYPVYHYAQGHRTSWFGFAKKIIEGCGNICKVKPTLSFKYSSVAMRPSNSTLDTSRIEKVLSLTIRDWESALSECIKLIQTNEVI